MTEKELVIKKYYSEVPTGSLRGMYLLYYIDQGYKFLEACTLADKAANENEKV